jgi:hypothetical protein
VLNKRVVAKIAAFNLDAPETDFTPPWGCHHTTGLLHWWYTVPAGGFCAQMLDLILLGL